MAGRAPILSGLPKLGFGTYRLRKDHLGHRKALSKVLYPFQIVWLCKFLTRQFLPKGPLFWHQSYRYGTFI